MSRENFFGSSTKPGISPQRTSAKRRVPSAMRTTAIGWVGAML